MDNWAADKLRLQIGQHMTFNQYVERYLGWLKGFDGNYYREC